MVLFRPLPPHSYLAACRSAERRCQPARSGLLRNTRNFYDEQLRCYVRVEKLQVVCALSGTACAHLGCQKFVRSSPPAHALVLTRRAQVEKEELEKLIPRRERAHQPCR